MQNINLSIYPFYDKLDTDSILLLKDNLQAIHIQKDNILFYQNDICDSILFLTSANYIVAAIGVIPLLTGAVGFCPLYPIFKINTGCKKD
ncbi:MAG: DUF2892 domain-containing protein [Sulfurimonas sp.]|nr:DUF2892 domain-containing protein [Sulfurimonas sp.]